MRYLRKVTPRWNYPGTPEARSDEYKLWLLDQKINDRGFAVDLDLARGAVDMVERHKKIMARKSFQMTDGEVESTTQRDALLKHLLEEYGVGLPDMQKGTLERRVNDENLPLAVRELLALRLEASGTSQAKYGAFMNHVSADGRARGTLKFCGAARTMRWAGAGPQPQNMPRPTLKAEAIEEGIEAIKSGVGDLVIDDPMKMASNAIRGCVIASEGKKLVVADLKNIEGRIAAWLGGETWKLKAFRDYDHGEGPDLYRLSYGRAFNVDPESVDDFQRQVGKVMELMLQYEGGVGAFVTGSITYKVDLGEMTEACLPTIPKDVLAEARAFLEWTKEKKRPTFNLDDDVFVACDSLKRLWRRNQPKIVSYWGTLGTAFREAILQPGIVTKADKVSCHRIGDWLRMRVPNGTVLCYADPKIERDGSISYSGTNSYTKQWTKLHTYPGKVFENLCQKVARDAMAVNMQSAEDAGFEIDLTSHDELITEAVDNESFTSHHLEQLLAATPWWADSSLPLAASGFETYRYRKA